MRKVFEKKTGNKKITLKKFKINEELKALEQFYFESNTALAKILLEKSELFLNKFPNEPSYENFVLTLISTFFIRILSISADDFTDPKSRKEFLDDILNSIRQTLYEMKPDNVNI